jgi:hypothetical protein
MTYVRSFGPWIAYFVGTAIGDWRLGLAAGLIVGGALLIGARHRGVDVISLAGTAYFALALPIALVAPDNGLRNYTSVLAPLVLGIAATASNLIDRPFNHVNARAETPEELWHTDVFLQVNKVITWAWAISFFATAAAVGLAVSLDPDAVAVRIALQVAGFVGPIIFTNAYRQRVAARYAV